MSLTVSVRRWLWVGLMFAAAGCTTFQTLPTERWFDTHRFESEQPINHILTLWSPVVHTTTSTSGQPLRVLAGRLFLFNEHDAVEAQGTVIVKLVDMTRAGKDQPANVLGEWRFDPANLRTLKRKDGMGEGYTLVLPWESYNPKVRDVQMQVCYVARNGTPRHAEPQNMTLQSPDQPLLRVTERQVVPGRELLEQQQRLQQAQSAVPTPIP